MSLETGGKTENMSVDVGELAAGRGYSSLLKELFFSVIVIHLIKKVDKGPQNIFLKFSL